MPGPDPLGENDALTLRFCLLAHEGRPAGPAALGAIGVFRKIARGLVNVLAYFGVFF